MMMLGFSEFYRDYLVYLIGLPKTVSQTTGQGGDSPSVLRRDTEAQRLLQPQNICQLLWLEGLFAMLAMNWFHKHSDNKMLCFLYLCLIISPLADHYGMGGGGGVMKPAGGCKPQLKDKQDGGFVSTGLEYWVTEAVYVAEVEAGWPGTKLASVGS